MEYMFKLKSWVKFIIFQIKVFAKIIYILPFKDCKGTLNYVCRVVITLKFFYVEKTSTDTFNFKERIIILLTLALHSFGLTNLTFEKLICYNYFSKMGHNKSEIDVVKLYKGVDLNSVFF